MCAFETNVFPLTFLFNRRNFAHQLNLLENYCSSHKDAIWICKPGENSNQGQGISIEKDFLQLKARVDEFVKFADKKANEKKYLLSGAEINTLNAIRRSNGLLLADNEDNEQELESVKQD